MTHGVLRSFRCFFETVLVAVPRGNGGRARLMVFLDTYSPAKKNCFSSDRRPTAVSGRTVENGFFCESSA